MKDRLEREGRRSKEIRDTVEDVRRFFSFSGENGRTRVVPRHRLQLGKIFLLLHLSFLEAEEKQNQGRAGMSGVSFFFFGEVHICGFD